MTEQSLISIITPGYNCGHTVHRLLDSILAQTWQNMEYIFVNDGSIDNTAEVLEQYRPRFAQRGIPMTVLTQPNGGIAAAVACGLQHAAGEYLCWCDADDYYEPDAMEVRAAFLDAHPAYAWVSGKTDVHDGDGLDVSFTLSPPADMAEKGQMFMRFLRDDDAYYCCGAHMLRTSVLLRANPDRYIYPLRTGQNLQMLLPVLYEERGYALDRTVYHYVRDQNSHSAQVRTEQQMLDRCEQLHRIRVMTLRHMQIPKERLAAYEQISHLTAHKAFLRVAFLHGDRELLKKERAYLKRHGAYDWTCRKYCMEASCPLYRCLIRLYRRLRKT